MQHSSPTTTPQAGSSSDKISTDQQPKSESVKSVLSTIILLLLAPLLAILLTAFVFQSYEVDGPSMEQTLHNHDRLIVLKMPRSWANITHHTYMPHRNDIIVFNRIGTGEFSGAPSKQLIKRVIGLPGDHVVVRDNHITIYNSAHPDGFNPDSDIPNTANNKDTPGNTDLTVPDEELFVSGDNRTNSLDSRYFGTVPASDVVGKLVLRIYPFNKMQAF